MVENDDQPRLGLGHLAREDREEEGLGGRRLLLLSPLQDLTKSEVEFILYVSHISLIFRYKYKVKS